jgi:hypothetical protein
MSESPLEQIFPERNRSALEGSPERSAFEAGERTIRTTFGHAATKVWEMLAPHLSQGEVQRIVLRLFPVESHRDECSEESVHIISRRAEAALRDAFVAPLSEEQLQLARDVSTAVQPLVEEAHAAENGCITLLRLYTWLQTANIDSCGSFDQDRIKALLVYFAYSLCTDWEKALSQSEGLPDELAGYLLDSHDLEDLFANAFAEHVFAERMKSASKTVADIYQSMLGLFMLTPQLERQLLAKYPIRSENR